MACGLSRSVGVCGIWLLLVMNGISTLEVNYFLMEEKPIGTRVGNIANDSDLVSMIGQAEFRNLRFNILSEDDSSQGMFVIHEYSGEILTAQILNRERVCPFSKTCVISLDVAAQTTSGLFFRIITVNVFLQDINDNSPSFPKSHIVLNISESVTVESQFPLDGATDPDTGINNSVRLYEMHPPDSPFGLRVDLNLDGSSDIRLVTKERLDREMVDFHRVFITAKDAGSPRRTGTLTVDINVVDFNDNRPVFVKSTYNITVDETTKSDTVILRVTATDRDTTKNGMIWYRFSPHQEANIDKIFQIDQVNGELSVVGPLQYESDDPYRLVVEATDKGIPSLSAQAIVYINVRDTVNDRPSININLLNGGDVSEGVNISFVVAYVRVTDEDTGRNGEIVCFSDSAIFTFKRVDTKIFNLIVSQKLDREQTDHYMVIITCRDNGNPSLSDNAEVSINVLDENDNPPIFAQSLYSTSVMENSAGGEFIVRVSATDEDSPTSPNSNIIYSFHNNKKHGFIISRHNGEIYTNTSFDREKRSSIKLKVLATDMGVPPLTATATVMVDIIDINDNAPIFNISHYTFLIKENKPPQILGTIHVHDPDDVQNGQFYLNIHPLSTNFTLYSNGTLKSMRKLDREAQAKYVFTITATDEAAAHLTSSTIVTIIVEDANDNAPYFVYPDEYNNNTARVFYPGGAAHHVANILAEDIDEGANRKLMYYLEGGNEDGLFNIDVESGEIYMTRTVRKEDSPVSNLLVSVSDKGFPQRTNRTYLIVEIVTNNSTLALASDNNQGIKQYILVIATMTCVTIVLAAAIVLTICLLKRRDEQRRSYKARGEEMKVMKTVPSDSSGSQLSDIANGPVWEKQKPENTKSPNLDKRKDANGQHKSAFSTFKSSQPNGINGSTNNQQSGVAGDGNYPEMNRLASNKFHTALILSQNAHDKKQLHGLVPGESCTEESHSEGNTSDSGRGGSEEDIQNGTTPVASNANQSNLTSAHNVTRAKPTAQKFSTFHGTPTCAKPVDTSLNRNQLNSGGSHTDRPYTPNTYPRNNNNNIEENYGNSRENIDSLLFVKANNNFRRKNNNSPGTEYDKSRRGQTDSPMHYNIIDSTRGRGYNTNVNVNIDTNSMDNKLNIYPNIHNRYRMRTFNDPSHLHNRSTETMCSESVLSYPDDDDCYTTTSGSYTLSQDDINLECSEKICKSKDVFV